MQHPTESQVRDQSHEITSLTVLFARLTWVFFGPVAMLLALARIASLRTGWLTGLDLFCGVVLALMLLGRWVEHRYGTATNARGEPATAAQFRRYMIALPLLAAGLWVAANIVGNYLPS
ncbi:MAG: hypothetical protein U1A27_12150 [Phycisphaerae bacterium]